MKRTLSLLLTIFILVSVISVVPYSAWNIKILKADGFYYQILNGKYAEVTGIVDIDNSDAEIYIPEEINGYKVTSIGEYFLSDADWNYLEVDEIIIPDTVTHIGKRAFYLSVIDETEYEGLQATKINIPSGVVYIGYGAFENCRYLKNITIPESVIHIGDNAFKNCDKLTDITIHGTVRYLGKEAFADCDKLKSVIINHGVNTINEKAFYNCKNLSEVSLPESVRGIYSYAFHNCPELKEVTLYDYAVAHGDNLFGYYEKGGKVKKVQGFRLKCMESKIDNCGGKLYCGIMNCRREIYNSVYYLNPDYTQKIISEAGRVYNIKISGKTVKKWTSSKKSVATITNKGKLTALRNGKTTLKATLSDGTIISRVFKVEGKPELDPRKITVKVGQKKQVVILGKAEGVNNVYQSTSIAKITGSKKNRYFYVKGLKKGTTTLKITVNGMKLKLKVKVK